MIKKIGDYSYDQSAVLGRGTFGSVYRGFHNKTKTRQPVAIKVISLEPFPPQQRKRLLDNFRNEVTNMQLAEGENIVQLLAIPVSERNLYLVCEYCNEGSLDTYIYKQRRLSQKEAMRIMTQIIKGFKCLHENNIVHRDLKPANILLHDSVAKVGDFGFSKLTEGHDQLLLSLVGTPQYMSPQILSGTHYTEKTDIWSLGIILYQMLFGRVPWDAAKDVDTLVKHIQQQKVRIPEVPKISRATAYLIEHMLQYEEASRIGWWELFSYDFYGGKESREETLSREVKSLSINSSESLEEKSFNYAKIYFQCSKMILDTNELRRRSITNNDLVKTIVSGYGSREIEPRSKNYHTQTSSNHKDIDPHIEKILSRRNQAVIFISMYINLSSLAQEGLIEVSVAEIALQLLLLKQAFVIMFTLYRNFKNCESSTSMPAIDWTVIIKSQHRKNMQSLSSYDNTMCNILYQTFLKKFKLARDSLQLIEEEDQHDLSEIIGLANKQFDQSGRTSQLLHKYMWHFVLKTTSEKSMDYFPVLKLCTLLSVYLKKMQEADRPDYSRDLAKLYDYVESTDKQIMRKLVIESVNAIS